nr:reverse transcriptase domain-containing protein [Tanacetum cinerariifolium]
MSLQNEIENLKTQLKGKKPCVTSNNATPKVPACSKYAIDVQPIRPRQRNNRVVHHGYLNRLRDTLDTLREIVKEARSERPFDNNLDYACVYTKRQDNVESEKVKQTWKPTVKIFTTVGHQWKPTGRTLPLGFGDYVLSDSVISRVYYVEGLGHNLFSVGQFCDSDLEVAFRKHTCFIKNLDGVNLIKGSHGLNLYTNSVEDTMRSSPICLLSKASKNKSGLWRRRLSHLNFEAIATACYTQNRSLVHTLHNKTLYELVHDKKLDLSFLCVFGAHCYPTNDSEDLEKLKAKADIGLFFCYAPNRKGYQIYNKRTRQIMKTVHVTFDELTGQTVPVQTSLGPAPNLMMSVHISSGFALQRQDGKLVLKNPLPKLLSQPTCTQQINHKSTSKNRPRIIRLTRLLVILDRYPQDSNYKPKPCSATMMLSSLQLNIKQEASPAIVEPLRIENPFLEDPPKDPPEVPMADNRTMAELLRAPTKGYEDAIFISEIAANNFELKHGLINLFQNKQFFGHDKEDPHAHICYFNKITSTMRVLNVPSSSIMLMLFPFSLEGAARIWLEKEAPRSILTWEDLVSKFINQFFPPSKMTNLRNEITRFQQRFDESFYEAWERFNDLLRACP